MQGLLVAAGNPHDIKGLSDLIRPGIRYVNRQPGSGTRLLLDNQIERLQLDAEAIDGYGREELTHSAVAAQIAAGSADAGLGIYAAASLFQLDFIPVAEENYDFVISRAALEWPQVKLFLRLLASPELRRRLEKMGGYRLPAPGCMIWPSDIRGEKRDGPDAGDPDAGGRGC